MSRLWRSVGALLVSGALLGGGTALAAPPSWAHGGGPDAGSPSTAPSSSNASPSEGQVSSAVYGGSEVSLAVYNAHQAGLAGTPLAEAVHEVLLTEHADARGLSVAEAVYAARNGGGSGGAAPFADVQDQAPWASAAVDALRAAGVVDGTSSSTFSPNQPVTLAELATMLARLQAGSSAGGAVVPSGTPSWAQAAMAWADAGGVLSGEQGLGSPNAPLTRAQAVLMLINALGLGPQAATLADAAIGLQGAPPPWAHGAMALAVQLGLLQGSGGQLLSGQVLTRAQMAVLLSRMAALEVQASGSGSTGG